MIKNKLFVSLNIINQTGLLFSYLNFICVLWLLSTIPFSVSVQRPALYAFFISFILDFTINKRWKDWQWTKDKWEYIAWIIFFLLIPLYHIFENSEISHYNRIFNYRLPFWGIGLVALLSSRRYDLKYIAYVIILTATFSSLYLIFYKIGIMEFICTDDKMITFRDARVINIGSHMKYNFYLNIALVYSFYIIKNSNINKLIRILIGICALYIYYTLSITDGRNGLIAANLLILLFVLSFASKKHKKILILLGSGLSIILFFLILNHPRLEEKVLHNEPRLFIWEVAFQTAMENPILGKGVSDGRDKFVENGMKNKRFATEYFPFHMSQSESNYPHQMHPHNIFLSTWIEFGISGVLLVLFFIFYPFYVCRNRTEVRFYVILFTLVVLIQGIFESFGPELSPLFITLNLLFLIGSYNSNKKNNHKYQRNSCINQL